MTRSTRGGIRLPQGWYEVDPQTRIAAMGSCSTKEAKSFYRPRDNRGFESHPFRFKEDIEPKVVLYLDKIGN